MSCICECHTGLGMGGVDVGCPQCKHYHGAKCKCGRLATCLVDGEARCGYHQPGFSKATRAKLGQPKKTHKRPIEPTGFVCTACRSKGAVLLCPHQEQAFVNSQQSAENVDKLKQIFGWRPTEYRTVDRHGAILIVRQEVGGLWRGAVRKAATDVCMHCKQQGTEHEHALKHALDDLEKAQFFTASLSDQIISPY